MPVTITLPDEIQYSVPGCPDFTHSLEGHTAEMILRGFAHGMRQMIIDSAAMTREEQAGLTAEQVENLKRDNRMAAFANRLAWLQSNPRMPSDDSIWVAECRSFLKLVGVGSKARASIKTVAEGTAALKTAGGAEKGAVYVAVVDANTAKKKAALADPNAAVAAMIAEALA